MEAQREMAAQEASEMPDLATEEQNALQKLFDMHDLREESVRPDGNCLYVAFASQLNGICEVKVNGSKRVCGSAKRIVRLQKAKISRCVVYKTAQRRLCAVLTR